jgi:peptidoglycan/xylan/chitin deacetylase (PgdA/CDA1 family)
MTGARTVIAVNYHRVGTADPGNPLHRLHTVPADVFEAQLDHMLQHGPIVSPDDVRKYHGLASTSFVVSFDDVPSAAMTGIQMMLDRQLPVTMSACTQLASAGWGSRDKVYCVDKYASPGMITAAMRAAFPDAARSGESFYHLTKRDDLDPDQVARTLVDPLFTQIESLAQPFLDGTGYLSWASIRHLARHPLVTIANHSVTHPNLAALPRHLLPREILPAHRQLTEHLGRPPTYLTIPFGRFSQRLAADCIDLVHPLGYRGILWVGEAATLVAGPYDAQLLQLTRLHAPATLAEFATRISTLARDAAAAAIWQLPPRVHREPVTITESSDQPRAARFEMLARQGKDYASSPGFYRYQFTANPAKGSRPDYYAVERDGHIEATAYNFHATFRVGAVTVPGVYLASWRRLPDAHQTAAGRLIQRMTSREAVVGVYHPSPVAAAAFTRWHQIAVWRLRLPVAATRTPVTSRRLHRAIELDSFDDTLVPLVMALMRQADFTLARDRAFYQWRHDSYPLAACRYIVLCRRAEPVAYAITLQRAYQAEIADWYAASSADYVRLAAAVQDSARDHGARTIEVETSSHVLASHLAARFAAPVTPATNFYHLNRARLAECGLTSDTAAGLSTRWPSLRFHETASTGDLLLR